MNSIDSILSGVHRIPAQAYHADPCATPSLSSTLAKKLLSQSPKHAWTVSPRLNPNYIEVSKKTFDVGRVCHAVLLGQGAEYAAYPDDILGSNGSASTKAAKDFAAECRDAGITPLKSDEIAKAELMADRCNSALAEMNIKIDTSRTEMTAIAEIDGTMCRMMTDFAPDPSEYIYDYKTCEDASPGACIRSVMTYGYDVQAAHYLETWKAATGEDRQFRFIFQEKSSPHEVTAIELGQDDLAMARKKTARAREIWRMCLESNEWPGYPRLIATAVLPEFFHSKWLDREMIEADFKHRTGTDILGLATQWQSPQGIQQAGE